MSGGRFIAAGRLAAPWIVPLRAGRRQELFNPVTQCTSADQPMP